ncbi:uncharacterized protein [Macrobrachium rosenbergii]|uniref:uncharacterized protein n=1 Tax=Macrobrachium rosenbergii TaxID=79674 RepID=UPI0034D65222
MDTKEELLISLVYRRTALWDPRHRDHRDRNVINRLWGEISLELGISANELRMKWRGLRDCYAKEMRNISNSSPGISNELSIQSSWPLIKQMSFMRDVTPPQDSAKNSRPVPGESTMGRRDRQSLPDHLGGIVYASQNELSFASQIHLNDEEEIDGLDNPAIVDVTGADEKELPSDIAGRGAKRKSLDDSWRENVTLEARAKKLEVLARSPNGEETDEDLLFFKSLLPDMRLLPRTRKLSIKIRMQELLLNELNSLQQPRSPSPHVQTSRTTPSGFGSPNVQVLQLSVDEALN